VYALLLPTTFLISLPSQGPLFPDIRSNLNFTVHNVYNKNSQKEIGNKIANNAVELIQEN